jgi:hypothetical protein
VVLTRRSMPGQPVPAEELRGDKRRGPVAGDPRRPSGAPPEADAAVLALGLGGARCTVVSSMVISSNTLSRSSVRGPSDLGMELSAINEAGQASLTGKVIKPVLLPGA